MPPMMFGWEFVKWFPADLPGDYASDIELFGMPEALGATSNLLGIVLVLSSFSSAAGTAPTKKEIDVVPVELLFFSKAQLLNVQVFASKVIGFSISHASTEDSNAPRKGDSPQKQLSCP